MGSKGKHTMPRNKKTKRTRWKKGQSSSSNPTKKRFREAAKSRFFAPPGKASSSLTVDALAKHDKSQENEDDYDITDQDGKSTGASTSGHSFKTWASNWTECTNTSFSNVHRYWASNDALHREILAVLAAVTEVIKTQGGQETETEYFGALMTTLKVTEGEQSLTAVAHLLSLVLKRVPNTVLRSRFSEVSKTLLDLLAKYADGESSSLLKSLLICVALVLRVQERAIWSNSSTHQVYRGLLTFITHKRPKVRKSAHQAVCIVLKGSLFMTTGDTATHHPAAIITAKHCISEIESCGGSERSTDTLHILGLLKDILGVLPHTSVKSLCETILRVLTLGSVMITTCGMQALHGLFSSRPKASTLPADLNAQLITALYDYQPAENDVQPMQAWLTVMEKAHINLARLDEKLCLSHLPRIISSGMACLLSDNSEVALHATKIMKSLLKLCLPIDIIQATTKSIHEGSTTPLHKLVKALESGLSYQFHASWGLVLQLFAAFIEAVGKPCQKLFPKCLTSIAELRESPRFPFKGELDNALGCAVKFMGPRVVLEAVPLKITGEIDDTNFPRSWLLPLLRDNIQETELDFFTSYFLPLAARLRQRAQQLVKEENLALAETYDTLQSQIWSFLPGFCTRPTDLAQSFKGIAKVLGTAINDLPDLRMKVMLSLRKLVVFSLNDEESRREIAQFAKNFLPIFFNLYTIESDGDEENSRLSVLETVKCYLQITEEELVATFCDRCIQKMGEDSVTPFRRHALLDLAITMLPYVDKEHLKQIYAIAVSNLQTLDRTLQKKCYKVLETICKCSSNNAKMFVNENLPAVQESLLESLSTSSPSSKAPRLRCLILVIQQLKVMQEDFIKAVIPEAVMCTREIGERARAAAYGLIVKIGNTVMRLSEEPKDGLRSYVGLVLASLDGSPQTISSTLLALTRILYEFKDLLLGPLLERIIDSVCLLLLSRTREIVKSALAFIKVLLMAYPETTLAGYLKQLMSSLVSMQDDCRHHFRFKTKDIYTKLVRKFGYETIYGMSSQNIQKVLVNIHKTQKRLKKKKLEGEEEEEEEDELETFKAQPESLDEMLRDTDSELEENDKKNKTTKGKKSGAKQGRAWLTEEGDDIIDFLDPTAAKKVTATKPSVEATGGKKQPKDHGFKTSKDGRLVITDDSEGEDDNEEKDIDDLDELLEAFESGKRSKSRGKKRKADDIDSDTEAPSKAKYQAGGHGIHRPLQKEKAEKPFGADYKAKKAGGDIKKKGKPDPYAYVPLNIQNLNKRKRAKRQGQFQNIVRGAKKGALKGTKAKKKNIDNNSLPEVFVLYIL
ncbi:hypothetical protein ScPMuIL_000022 [Solemya velum]